MLSQLGFVKIATVKTKSDSKFKLSSQKLEVFNFRNRNLAEFYFFISLAPNIEIFVDFLLKFVDFLLKNNVAEKTYRLYKEAFS